MSGPFLAILALLMFFALIKLWSVRRRSKRAAYIRTYVFPPGLLDRFGADYPELSAKDRHLVARALRQFFLAYLNSGRQFVSMPSRVVDDLWHAFILYTRHYQAFCHHAFGGFLHHTPAVVLGANRQNNAGLRRTWWFACREEKIHPKRPTRLPLLFALDEKLHIEHGFRYALDCRAFGQPAAGDAVHCGADFLNQDMDGTLDGLGDVFFGDGDGGSDGGGGGGGD